MKTYRVFGLAFVPTAEYMESCPSAEYKVIRQATLLREVGGCSATGEAELRKGMPWDSTHAHVCACVWQGLECVCLLLPSTKYFP